MQKVWQVGEAPAAESSRETTQQAAGPASLREDYLKPRK
jgi:hypothetical protein